MNLFAKDIASKANYINGVEDLALKHLIRTWNQALEEAAKIAEVTSSCPKDTAEDIRSLKK